MSTSPSETWNDILKGNVEKDDPLWKLYLDKAAVFDTRMVDEWNKIVDVLLVYVALFIAVLTSFIIQTFTQFQRNPADITNDLLLAIYNQLAQPNNSSISSVDPGSYFQQSKADNDKAFLQNSLLYSSLSLSISVSVIALVSKLWLVSYSRQAFSVGSPYERAMKRQEAYNGVLVWNLGGVINMLPVILLIALFSFEIYVYMSVSAIQQTIGFVVGGILNMGVMFIGFTSLGGAFFSGCPFRSVFSSVIRHIFEIIKTPINRGILSIFQNRKWVLEIFHLLFWVCIFLGLSFGSVTVYPTAFATGTWFSLFFPFAIPFVWSVQREAVHIPQKYKISHLALWIFPPVSLMMIVSMCFGYISFFLLSIPALTIIILACSRVADMSKSMIDTGEIDAIAWLLTTTPPQYPATLFKKAGQMTGFQSIGCLYRPRLLESLMPFLTLLTTSYHTPVHHNSDTHPLSSSHHAPEHHSSDTTHSHLSSSHHAPEHHSSDIHSPLSSEHHAPEVPEHHSPDTHSPLSSEHHAPEHHSSDTHSPLSSEQHAPEHHSSDTHSPLSSPHHAPEHHSFDAHSPLSSEHHAPEHHSSDTHSPSSSLSFNEDPHLKNIEIYIACLARLSDFADSKGNSKCLWEDARQHPKLEQPLIDKLVMFANPRHHFHHGLRSAATKVLNNFELDMEGNPVREVGGSPATRSVATVLRSAAARFFLRGSNSQNEQGHPILPEELELATHVEPPHSLGEIEEV